MCTLASFPTFPLRPKRPACAPLGLCNKFGIWTQTGRRVRAKLGRRSLPPVSIHAATGRIVNHCPARGHTASTAAQPQWAAFKILSPLYSTPLRGERDSFYALRSTRGAPAAEQPKSLWGEMIPLRASASSRPCTLTSSVYAVRDVTLSEPPPPFLPSVIRGYLIRQSRTHSRRGGRE